MMNRFKALIVRRSATDGETQWGVWDTDEGRWVVDTITNVTDAMTKAAVANYANVLVHDIGLTMSVDGRP